MEVKIKHINTEDWQAIAAIYKQGIDTGMATFETETPSWSTWDTKFLKSCRLAAWLDHTLVGWAALSLVSERSVYRGVTEVSVYIDSTFNGKGVGKQLMINLIDESEKAGIWTLQSGIFRENKASIYLHKNVGFRHIGYREKVGQRNGVWFDNIIMERRSKTIGIH